MNMAIIKGSVLHRDSYSCQICFKKAENVHHIIPKRMGGLDILENLISVCKKCHNLIELVRHDKIEGNSHTIRLRPDLYEHIRQWVDLDHTFDDIIRAKFHFPDGRRIN